MGLKQWLKITNVMAFPAFQTVKIDGAKEKGASK
jgi:hypothetical protein